MLRFYRYTFTLRRDSGTVKLTTAARNKQAAREIIKRAERCPDRAIVAIVRKPL